MTRTEMFGIRFLPLAAAAVMLVGCASYSVPKLVPTPVMANPPEVPDFEKVALASRGPYRSQGPSTGEVISQIDESVKAKAPANPDYSRARLSRPDESGPYPSTINMPQQPVDPKMLALFVPDGGMPTVPGANDPWFGIRDEPLKNRDAVVLDIDASIRQLGGPLAVQKASIATPGLEAQHKEAVQKFDSAMRDLQQKRDMMNNTTDPAIWEQNKDQFHDAWQAVERAYAQARATGN